MAESGPKLRLFDVYLNAFYRVVELCLNGLTSGGGTAKPQNEAAISDFVQWEQSLRRNLTKTVWEENPSELSGSWELVDVAGIGSLEGLMSSQKIDELFGVGKGMNIDLRKDGMIAVGISNGLQSTGGVWKYRPGPAHLDTCEFTFSVEVDAGPLLLSYTGYIDRGQRIESRLSNRPIRMAGRVVSSIGNDAIATGRFVMVLRKSTGTKPLRSFQSSSSSFNSRPRSLDCGPAASFAEGERRIVDYEKGAAIIVAKVNGRIFAIDARCPHLGLPMKRGTISSGVNGDDPTITCNFHNSVFSLNDGSCKTWCSKVMGIPGTEWIASASGKFGGLEYSPATVYKVSIENDRVITFL
jgi:nitrite reductase/ring-hydroxylating ferredoxin subunit